MKTKSNIEMLQTIKQYNKTARETKAQKEGFKDSVSMIAYLDGFINAGLGKEDYFSPIKKNPVPEDTIPHSPGPRPLIHVVDVLDASGSMQGVKYNAAIKGINTGVLSLRKDKAEVDYTYTLCDFSDDIIFRQKTSKLSDVAAFKGFTRGSTALYDAIGYSIELVKEVLKDGEKVLVNVYTDGQENSSKKYRSQDIASLIEELSKYGWTFTFIGTDGDVKYAQRNLKFDLSNTLVHDNTGAGMEKAFLANTASRAVYSTKVSAGEDVSIGFYKNIE